MEASEILNTIMEMGEDEAERILQEKTPGAILYVNHDTVEIFSPKGNRIFKGKLS